MSDRFDPLLDTSPDPSDDAGDAFGSPGAAAELPGADRPEWMLPVFVVAFAGLIAWLVIFGQPDTDRLASDASGPPVAADVIVDDESSSAEQTEATAVDPPPDVAEASAGADPAADTQPADVAADGPGVDGAVVDPIADAAAEAAETTAPDVVDDLDLPGVGMIRVGDDEFPLARSCVGLRPFAPADDGDEVSAHVFAPAGEGSEQVIERWVTGDGIGGVRVDGPGSAGVRQVSVVDGPDGAFTATLERPDGQVVDVALVPLPEPERACTDAVVTNEPGQFAFPHTRAVLTSCVSGDPAVDGRVVATLTEGARIVATGNGDGTATIEFRAPETLSSAPLDLTDPSAELFADGTRLGWSGLPSDGEVARDLTFDLDTAGSRACTDADTGLTP